MRRPRAARLALLLVVALAAPAAAQPDVDALIELGVRRYEANDLPGAFEAFDQAHKRAPRNPRPLYLRAQVYRDQKKLAEAEAGFRAALALDPTLVKVRAELGSLLTETGRPREAVIELTRVVAEQPDDFEAQFNLGVAHEALGDNAAAVDAYRRAVRLKPADPDAHQNLAVALLRTGKLDDALVAAREAVRLAPSSAVARRNLGLILADAKRFDEAVAELTTATGLAPNDYRGFWRLGLVEMRRNQPARAAAAFERARALNASAEVLTDLGVARRRLGDLAAAESSFRDALRADAAHHPARLYLASTLAATARCPQALAELAAVPAKPDYAEMIGNIRTTCPAPPAR